MLSITSNSDYPAFCALSAADEAVFRCFRRHLTYPGLADTIVTAVEHVTQEQGRGCLDVILSQTPELQRHLDAFRENDKYGDPRVFSYGQFGEFSPTTLRYIKILGELKLHFGSLDGFRIIEIGGGYGGQCRLICKFFDVASYDIVDIPPALDLARKYLSQFGVDRISYRAMSALDPRQKYDLIISNYAYTELSRELQDIYLRDLLCKATRGYLACNFISKFFGIDSYSPWQLIRKLWPCQVIDEKPLTGTGNFVLLFHRGRRREFVTPLFQMSTIASKVILGTLLPPKARVVGGRK